jgi:hypothetical protein
MVETGVAIFYWLILPAIALPFITAIIIFLRRAFQEEALTLLMLTCLLLAIKNLVFAIGPFQNSIAPLYDSLFSIGEFVLLTLLFRSGFQHARIKELTNYLLIAFVSVALTLHATSNNTTFLTPLSITQAGIVVALSLTSLLTLIRNQYIFIFHSPLFWIAGGTLFYFIMIIAAEILSRAGLLNETSKAELLAAFSIIRFVFYLVAAIIRQPTHVEEEWKQFKNSSPEHRR